MKRFEDEIVELKHQNTNTKIKYNLIEYWKDLKKLVLRPLFYE
nr:hypothetical protein [Mycoplasmopsis bovis]